MLSFSGDHECILDQDEFVNGIYELLHPTTQEGLTLAARIAKGNLVEVSNLRLYILGGWFFFDFPHRVQVCI